MKKKNQFAQPSLWGSAAWRMLHCISLTYPEKPSSRDKEDMWRFLTSMGDVLPCRLCRTNYSSYIQKNPFRLDNREELVDWMIDLHNSVNRRLKKKVLSREEAMESIRSLCYRS